MMSATSTQDTTFIRVGVTPLYLSANQQTGVLIRKADDDLPDTLTIDQAMNDWPSSILLVLSEAVRASPTAQSAAAGYLEQAVNTQPDDSRVAWIESPNSTRPRVLASIDLLQVQDAWQIVDARQRLVVQNLSLQLAGDSAVEILDTGLSFTPPAGEAHWLVFADSRDKRSDTRFDLTDTATVTLLDGDQPAGGWALGRFAVSGEASNVIQPAVRYFIPDTDSRDSTIALVHPLLEPVDTTQADADTARFELNATVDLWALSQPDRTWFAMAASAPLPGTLRTVVGDGVELTPQADARLTLAADVLKVPDADYRSASPYYFTPGGSYQVSAGGDSARLSDADLNMQQAIVAGASALEFFTLATADAENLEDTRTLLRFTPGQAAWAALQEGTTEPDGAPPRFAELSDEIQTAWAQFESSAGDGVTYHAQPAGNALFGPSQTSPDDGGDGETDDTFLDFLTPVAGWSGTADQPFPLAPVQGVDPEQVNNALALGEQILTPTRRALIPVAQSEQQVPSAAAQASAEDLTLGVTIQGFVLETSGPEWPTLDIGQSDVDRKDPLQLYNISGGLKAALQTDQLFLTASDMNRFVRRLGENPYYPERPINQDGCDLAYVLNTSLQFETLRNVVGVPGEMVDQLEVLKDYPDWPVIGEDAFFDLLIDTLDEQTQPLVAVWGNQIANVAVQLTVTTAGWSFPLSPYSWADSGTILIFKFLPQALDELVQNMASWSFPEVFNASPGDVQTSLNNLIEKAKNNEKLKPLAEIVTDPNWVGVLALNVATPLDTLPAQLKGLAAGIDPNSFQASYVSIDVTPVDLSGGDLNPLPSSYGVLLDYVDPQVPPQAGGAAQWDYSVQELRVQIEASAITEFASRVALFSFSYFGDTATLQGGRDYLILNGYYQQENGQDTYIFSNTEDNVYSMAGSVLRQLNVDRIQFYTLQQETGDTVMVQSRFLMDGRLSFARLDPTIDLFSYGEMETEYQGSGLRARGFALDMAFNLTIPTQKTMDFDPTGVVVDGAGATPRIGSLARNFPIQLTELQTGDATNSPAAGDYMPVDIDITSAGLQGRWYGLVYDLDLGSPGALAAPVGFTAQLLVGWSPGSGDTPKAYVGLALPGVSGGARSMSLQGVIELVFGTVGLVVGVGDEEQVNYTLQLRRIALKILSLTIPSSASIDFYLFGDPSGDDKQTVGWYAAYQIDGLDAAGRKTLAEQFPANQLPGRQHLSSQPLRLPTARPRTNRLPRRRRPN